MKRILSLMTALLFAVAPLTGCAEDANIGIIGGADGPTTVLVGDTSSDDTADSTVDTDTVSAEPSESGGISETPPTGSDSSIPDVDLDLSPAVTGTEIISLGNTVLEEEGWYSTKEEVALYLMQYKTLPGNYITKSEARKLGWEGGSLEPYAPGMSIGGDHFGNYEGSLPEADDREYSECDIDTQGAESRGTKRIVYSDDGLIFYTEDHYSTFTLLSGGD